MRPHSKHRVQHKHTLLRPFRQAAMVRNRTSQIIVELLIYIHKRRRDLHTFLHREAQSMRLAVVMVRILPEDHHLYIFKRRQMERIKNVLCGRKYKPCPVFMIHRIKKFLVIWFGKFSFQSLVPVSVYPCHFLSPRTFFIFLILQTH